MDVTQRFQALLKVDYPTKFIGETIPIFEERSEEEREDDKYDKKDSDYVDRYTGLFAFAHILLGHGGAEGLYRSINYAMLSNLDRNAENTVLDIGCGVGRTLYDNTDVFRKTFFVGMDYAYKMCIRAQEILIDGKEISLADSLSYTGFHASRPKLDRLKLDRTKKAQNIFIAQGSVIDLPFKNKSFNCVVNTNLIDRVPDPRTAIAEMARVLKPRGLFILSDPLNFDNRKAQKSIRNKETLIKVIENEGVKITEWFDNLVYREVKDVRGNYEDFMTFVCIARKL